MTTTVFWACLHCEANGDTTGTESGNDAKHVRDTGHSTVSSTKPRMFVSSTQED